MKVLLYGLMILWLALPTLMFVFESYVASATCFVIIAMVFYALIARPSHASDPLRPRL